MRPGEKRGGVIIEGVPELMGLVLADDYLKQRVQATLLGVEAVVRESDRHVLRLPALTRSKPAYDNSKDHTCAGPTLQRHVESIERRTAREPYEFELTQQEAECARLAVRMAMSADVDGTYADILGPLIEQFDAMESNFTSR